MLSSSPLFLYLRSMEDKIGKIVEALKNKACVKQSIYRSTHDVFDAMREHARDIATNLDNQFQDIDKSVRIVLQEVSEFEFHLKFSGDLLIFTMHTNVIAFPPEHILNKSPYIQEKIDRGYFGQIMVYNFTADSIKYNRLSDQGYLIARLMLNQEKHFYIEGPRQLNFLYPDVAQNLINDMILRVFIEDSMLLAIDSDLVATNFQEIMVLSLGQKMANQQTPAIEKVGFQIAAQQN